MAALGIAMASLLGGCQGAMVASSTSEFPQHTGFMQRQLIVDGQPHIVWIFIPKSYRPDYRFPAVLFLHGLFEAGDGADKDKVLSAGLGPVIGDNPDNWPFITIFPQSTGTWQGEDRERLALASLDYAERPMDDRSGSRDPCWTFVWRAGRMGNRRPASRSIRSVGSGERT